MVFDCLRDLPVMNWIHYALLAPDPFKSDLIKWHIFSCYLFAFYLSLLLFIVIVQGFWSTYYHTICQLLGISVERLQARLGGGTKRKIRWRTGMDK